MTGSPNEGSVADNVWGDGQNRFWFPKPDSGCIVQDYRVDSLLKFRNSLYDMKTLLEQTYQDCLSAVLCKPLWWEKMNDRIVTSKWRSEVEAYNHDISFQFLMDEIKHVAEKRMKIVNGMRFWPLPPPGTLISDNAVPLDLAAKFSTQIRLVEQEALASHRWHPESGDKVLDLFHPSNFCVVYGRTTFSRNPGALFGDQVLEFPDFIATHKSANVSRKYQWLPSVFNVNGNGTVNVESYINNLSPMVHRGLYETIGRIFGIMLPMFERAIGSLTVNNPVRIKYHGSNETKEEIIEELWEMHCELDYEKRLNLFLSLPVISDEEDEEEYYSDEDDHDITVTRPVARYTIDDFNPELERAAFEANIRRQLENGEGGYIEIPTLGSFKNYLSRAAPSLEADKRFGLTERRLKVIVKAASIFLTPEHPVYNGSSWHIEGTENEAIVATGIYYYSIENVEPSRVEFRELFNDQDMPSYPQDEHQAITAVFGIKSEETVNLQRSGFAESREGRCLVFPNSNQHRVPKFALVDPTKPGWRKTLVFFLVHPDANVPSTREVPMQQFEWGVEGLYKTLKGRLPIDIVREVVKFIGCLRTIQEDNVIARAVLEERKKPDDLPENSYTVALCEH
ncbi:hypothetical protein HDU67_008165 [Dinochytrium kinnereticum]|nr:hypothetical protein HDU67_008165 [Dinochytrium kinnereticum]